MDKDTKYCGVNRLWILPSFASQPLGISIERIFVENGWRRGRKYLYG
jgi:hypothetical protein